MHIPATSVSSVRDLLVTRQSATRTALAGLVGNVLEWFDFAVYGYFATDIGRQFFPQSDPTAQQLLAFAVFALGFVTRPIGSLALGVIGDRFGRRALLTFSIALMGGATLAIGVLPTYAQIGLVAPIALVTLRLVQGFSLGAEFTGAMVYTTEMAAPERRGLIGSASTTGSSIGFILGSGSAWLVRVLTHADPIAWHWRIPFVASVLLCVAGWFLRRGLAETPAGIKAAAARPPLVPSLLADWRPMLQTFGIGAMVNAAYYVMFTFVVERRVHEPGGDAFLLANTISLVVVVFAKAFGGWLSDFIGRRRLMFVLTCVMMALVYPLLAIMMRGAPWQFMVAQALFGIPAGMAGGLQGALIVELFPLRTRVTSMSFGYSMMIATAGGTAPLVSTWIIARFGHDLAPVYYILALGLLGLAVLWNMRETNGRSLSI
ncbi:MAG TPA: MFS transporter [Vicinamibacterales bacterium]|nr:MFS transporter [Vicinamibacterales bacterium]